MKPRIFLGSSGKQEKVLQALTHGLEDVADVEPWTTVFNPGTSTLERLVELTQEVDFAAFVFAQDDWTTKSPPDPDGVPTGQASPRDNVVFEAGLFGGALGMRRTFILHANGRSWQEDGTLSARYWSEASKERTDPAGVFYFWNGERPRHPDAPRLEGTGEIKLEAEDRASGYWTTRSERIPELNARTSGIYLRADPEDLAVLDGNDAPQRAELIADRLRDWTSFANS